MCAKGLIGSTAEWNKQFRFWTSFLVIVSWKDRSWQSCSIHESFQCFGDVTLYPGWIRVCVSCRSDVIELFCRVVLSLCCCCHFPDDDVSSRSGSRREESHERIEAVSLRETCHI